MIDSDNLFPDVGRQFVASYELGAIVRSRENAGTQKSLCVWIEQRRRNFVVRERTPRRQPECRVLRQHSRREFAGCRNKNCAVELAAVLARKRDGLVDIAALNEFAPLHVIEEESLFMATVVNLRDEYRATDVEAIRIES